MQRDLALVKEDSLGRRESEKNLRGARATTLGVRYKIRLNSGSSFNLSHSVCVSIYLFLPHSLSLFP